MPGTTDAPDDLPDEPVDPREPAGGDEDEQRRTDAAWAQIVAELSDLSTDPAAQRTTDVRDEDPGPGSPSVPVLPAPGTRRLVGNGPRDAPRTPEVEALDDADGEFVPPDPGFALSSDRLRNLGWFALVASLLALVLGAVLWDDAPGIFYTGAGAVFLVGVALLLWRLPEDREPPSDRGAVV